MSRPAHDLARRLLLAGAAAPAIASGAESPKRSFIGARALRLLAIGEVQAAVDLARAIPSRSEDEALSRALLDGMWLAYDNAGACALVRAQIARFTTVYWQKSLIFCQALASEHARAQLGLNLLREQETPEDAVFFRLVHALAGDTRATVESLRAPTPLTLAMIRAARQQIPADIAGAAEPAILRTVAQSPNAAPELRLVAAEHAEAFGALPAEALAQIYDAVTLTPEQIANAVTFAQSDAGPRGRAALYRAAKAQTVAIARVEALQRAWKLGRERGGYATAVRVALPLLAEIAPANELAWFAGEATRAYLIAGRPAEARPWYELLRNEAAAGNPLAAAGELQLAPLLRLAGGETWAAWDTKKFAAWRQAEERRDASTATARTVLLAALFDGVGDPVAASGGIAIPAGELAPQTVAMPHPAIWLGMRMAAESGRAGESALFGLAALGAEGAAGAGPYTLAGVIEALRSAGFEADARALAIEAAVASGL
ncbi:MAG: hypothetical protein HY057_10140 [Rhodospirillales bacterium]|nr:hypothetical protein [Rhodospirillales bacterium]